MRRLVVHVPHSHLGIDLGKGAQRDQECFFTQTGQGHPDNDDTLVGQSVAASLEILQIVEIGVGLVAQVGAVGGDEIVSLRGVFQIQQDAIPISKR